MSGRKDVTCAVRLCTKTPASLFQFILVFVSLCPCCSILEQKGHEARGDAGARTYTHAISLRSSTQVGFFFFSPSHRFTREHLNVPSSIAAKPLVQLPSSPALACFITPDFITGSQIQFDWQPVGRVVLPIDARRASGRTGST